MPYRRRGYRLGMRRRRFGGMLRRRYGRRPLRYGRRTRATVPRKLSMPPQVIKSVVSVSDATIDVGGVVTLLHTPLPPREMLRYISWRCVVGTVLTSNSSIPILRVMIFVDKRPNRSTPAVTDVLQTASVLSPLNEENANSGRFVILSDRTFTFNPGYGVSNATGTGDTNTQKRFYKFFRRLNLLGTSDPDDNASITNGLFCLYITDTDEAGTIDAQARVGAVSYNNAGA